MSKIKSTFYSILCAVFYSIATIIAGSFLYMQLFNTLGAAPIIIVIVFIIFSLLLYFGSLCLTKSTKKSLHSSIMRITFKIIFIVFIATLAYFTLFDSYFGRTTSTQSLNEYIPEHLKYTPFDSIRIIISGYNNGSLSFDFMLTNIVGNIFAFMPFSLFLPLVSSGIQKKHTFLKCTILTALSIIIVEVSQLFLMVGFCDIDDLILNLGGAVIGYGILHISAIRKLISKITLLDY